MEFSLFVASIQSLGTLFPPTRPRIRVYSVMPNDTSDKQADTH